MLPFSIISDTTIRPKKPKILKVTTSDNTIGVLYDNGEFYIRGNGNYYRLGNGSQTSITNQWYKTQTNVKYCFCGSFGTIVVKNDNTVWYVGAQSAVTGSTTTNTYYTTWTNITNYIGTSIIQSMTDIRLTAYAIMILSNRSIYALGYAYNYELGQNKQVFSSIQIVASAVQKIYSIGTSTIYIDTTGAVYRCGSSAGNYNLGSTTNLTAYTSLSVGGYKAQDVYMSNYFTLINYLNNAGTQTVVYAAGTGSYGAMGNGTVDLQTFTIVSSLTNVFSSFKNTGTPTYATLALGSSAGIYTSGWGSNYIKGTGSGANTTTFSNNVPGFTTVTPDQITAICPFGTYGTLILQNGVLLSSGTGWGTAIGLPTSTTFVNTANMPY